MWQHQFVGSHHTRLQICGLLGFPVTFATLWALVAACAGGGKIGLALLAVRI